MRPFSFSKKKKVRFSRCPRRFKSSLPKSRYTEGVEEEGNIWIINISHIRTCCSNNMLRKKKLGAETQHDVPA